MCGQDHGLALFQILYQTEGNLGTLAGSARSHQPFTLEYELAEGSAFFFPHALLG